MLANAEGPSDLAALVRRYFAEVETFNRIALADGRTEEQNDALEESTYLATLSQMESVPVRTAEDALAAIDFAIRQSEHAHGWEPAERMMAALRNYLAAKVA